jgi:mono/diheme cytochrome c family protein
VFVPQGTRRTQALHVGLAGTEPFHWDGDMSSLGTLMDEVFVKRMAGPKESPAREAALKDWLSGLQAPAAIADAASPQAARGKALFESASVGCASCHSGDKHTNNASVYVGTTEPGHLVQVPSLVGIGYRAPFLHNGCAATLRDRFDAKCGGGDLHGKTSGLSGAQLDDLVAYLETL